MAYKIGPVALPQVPPQVTRTQTSSSLQSPTQSSSAQSSPEVIIYATDPGIEYIGPWFQVTTLNDTGSFGSPLPKTLEGVNGDASLVFSFNGSAVSVYGSNGPYKTNSSTPPTYTCSLEDSTPITSYRTILTNNNWLLCSAKNIKDGLHTLTMNVKVTDQQTFWFDEIQYTPSSSVPIQSTLLINSDEITTYSDGWKWFNEAEEHRLQFKSTHYTQVTGATVQYQFNGTSLSCIGIKSLKLSGVTNLEAQATYSFDNQEPVPFLVGDKSLTNSPGMLLFESGRLPSGSHLLKIVYLGNLSMAPLAFSYFIINGPTLPSSSATIHRKPIIGGVIGGLVFISLLLNICQWPSHVL